MKSLIIHFALFYLSIFYISAQNMNLNRIVNENLTTENRINASGTEYRKFKIEKIETGKKDIEGNKIYYIKVSYIDDPKKKYNEHDSIILVPDFEPYPLVFKPKKLVPRLPEFYSGGERKGFNNFHNSVYYYLADTKTSTLAVSWTTKRSKINGMPDQYISLGETSFATTKKANFPDGAWFQKNWTENEENIEKEFIKQWETAIKYQTDKIEEAKKIGYDKMISEFDGKEIFPSISVGNIYHRDMAKIQVIKNGDKVESLILTFAYKDGKYYDKEEFKFEFKRDKNGFLSTDKSKKHLWIFSSIILPYDGNLILVSPENYLPNRVLAKDPYTSLPENILRIGNVVYQYSELREHNYNYKKWFMEKNIETTYKPETDILNYGTFFKKYYAAFKSK